MSNGWVQVISDVDVFNAYQVAMKSPWDKIQEFKNITDNKEFYKNGKKSKQKAQVGYVILAMESGIPVVLED